MQKLNRKVEYALMALQHMRLKQAQALTTAKEVAETYHAPFDATAKVMQTLAGLGWLKSAQGSTGGYSLQANLAQMTYLDLISCIEGSPQIAKCLKEEEGCEIHSCNISSPVAKLNERLHNFYESLNLEELLTETSTEKSSSATEIRESL
jgi:Rrf2 family protein